MKRPLLRNLFLKNAFANVLGGAGAALFNLLLPALAVRHLDKLEFSVWSLAIQVMVYIQLFGLGLQTVVTYKIANAGARSDLEAQRENLAAGFVLARYFASAAALAVVALVFFYPAMFGEVPAHLKTRFRVCIALFGFSAVSQLLALVPMGAFMGLQRNIVPVAIQLGARCFSLIAAGGALYFGASLIELSAIVGGSVALIAPLMLCMAKRRAAFLFAKPLVATRGVVRSMWSDCAGLAVWNIAMLLVNGIDTAVVGHFDFQKVAAYSLAATAITIFVGVLQAMLNPLVAMGSALSVDEKNTRLRQLLIRASRYCSLFLIAVVVVFWVVGKNLLPYWVGSEYVDDVYRFLVILLIAHGIRNLMAPYAVLLVSIGMQRQALFPAVVEGLVNLIASVMLASRLGAMGVAYGTLLGSVAGVVASTIYVVKHTDQLVESRAVFVRKILVIPLCSLGFLFFCSVY